MSDSNTATTIIVAEDHPMLLDALKVSLEQYGYNVITATKNGKTALDQVVHHNPDIALLDVDMPGLSGFEIVRRAKLKKCSSKFIVLTYHKEADFIAQARLLQIDGYLLKEEPFAAIHAAITTILNGGQYFSKSFQQALDENLKDQMVLVRQLTPSELKILKLVSENKDSSSIAALFNVSKRTIDKHRSNIIGKLNLSGDTNSLFSWAMEHRNEIQAL
jgi:DNA-binding NarL/FixJ family response regulator